jgi:MFS family permease
MIIMFGTGLLGTAFLTLNIYFLVLTGLPVIHCFDINIGGFCLALLIMPFTSVISDRVGRRPMYLSGILGTVIALAVVGGLGYASPLNKAADWALAVIL